MEQGRHRADRARRVLGRGSAGARRAFVWVVALACLLGGRADAQTPPAAPAPPAWTFTIRDMFRAESWRFFEPAPGGGDPDYVFAGNQLSLQATRTGPRVDAVFALQHVGLVHLPAHAVGPGALGTGALYFTQGNGRTNQQHLYLRLANVRLKRVAPGLDVRVGRQAYNSGAEAATADTGLEAIKRQRLDARLVGEFEWSQYQRSFDGVRVDWRTPQALVTGVAFMPTQGGFAREAHRTMTAVRLAGVTAIALPTARRPHTELQGFLWRYDDERGVTGRPDNTGLPADRADVAITTAGGTLVGAWPIGPGRVDLLGWAAVQRGAWYGQDHSAAAVAAEGGHQWTRVRWTPWVRVGWFHASGDDDPGDEVHGTFFPMLPTVRRFAQTTAYATMNLNDAFAQLTVRPARAWMLRAEVHRLSLASMHDRWYAGSGATLRTGPNFGYVGRPSNGATDLGTSVELTTAYTVSPRWTLSGFAGRIGAGPVVTGTFRGDRLWFAYVENVIWR